jgi:3-phosphoinositide dependent protein kinase-1
LILKEKKQEYVKREKSALHLLSNTPGICNLSCTFQDPKKLYFVLTYAKNGELLRYMKNGPLSLECAKFYAAELLLAIEQIHKKNIIHRDIKPENLLLNRSMHLMIADFGSSKLLPEGNFTILTATRD